MFAWIEAEEIYKYNIIEEFFKMCDPHQGMSSRETWTTMGIQISVTVMKSISNKILKDGS